MKRRDVLRSMALMPLVGQVAVQAEVQANASTLYLEAIAKLPERSDSDYQLLREVTQTPLDAAAKALVDRCAPALDLLRRGASAPACDWGDQWTTSKMFDGSMGLTMGGGWLAKVATLKARFAFRDKRDRAGLNLIIDVLTFARHILQGKVLMSQLFAFAMEHRAIETVARPLPRFSRENREYLSQKLTALPVGVSVRDVIVGERGFYLGYYVPCGDPKPTETDIKKYLMFNDRLSKSCDDPKAMAAIKGEVKDDDAYRNLIDNFDAFRLNALPYITVKLAMLRAAIAVVENGPSAIDRVLDPFDGKPFDLRTWATGFELTSRFALPDKPKASLFVGLR